MEFEPLHEKKSEQLHKTAEYYEDDDIDTSSQSADRVSDKSTVTDGGAGRDQWGSRCEFLLAIVGYTVGIGSVWRFPVMCARNGGGAFLVPFFFFMATCGGPLYYVEVCLGQFSGNSAGTAFEFCPLFRGIGFLMVLLSFNVLWYYLTIFGWIEYYLVHSFYSELPWATCGNWWNTQHCILPDQRNRTAIATLSNNDTSTDMTSYKHANPNQTSYTSPAFEFWTHNVLRKSAGLEDMGTVQWHLVICSLIGWALVVAALIKGTKSLGKVVYVTVIAPYVLLTVLLVRGLTLEGAIDGVVWYVTPDFRKLQSHQVWLDAAIQVFYSLGPTYGGVITMASHNKFHQKSLLETCICVASDAFTAFYAGLVVFACIGFSAHEQGISVEEAAKASGPGLAFVAYPEALTRMPLPQFWAVLFFLTLTTIIFDSAFGTYETVTGTICDMYPRFFARRKWLVLIGVALLLFVLSIPFCMNGGIYLFQLADWYVSSFSLLFGAVLETVIIFWIYGADRLARDIELMTGRKTSVLLRVLWCICVTGWLVVAFFITLASYKEPDYGDGYVYKRYAINIGIAVALSPMVPVVTVAIKEIYHAKGTLIKRVRTLLRPSAKWVPFDDRTAEMYRQRPYRYEDTLIQRVRRDLLGDKDTPWI